MTNFHGDDLALCQSEVSQFITFKNRTTTPKAKANIIPEVVNEYREPSTESSSTWIKGNSI